MKPNLIRQFKNSRLKIKQIRHFYFILFISLLFIQSGFTADIGQLYEASVKAEADKGENELISEAFGQVIIKVSGRSDVITAPAYNEILKKAENAISQFRYDYKSTSADKLLQNSTTDTKNSAEKSVKEKWFWIRFNPKMINALLAEAQIPVWGKIRPETLIWFSQEVKGKRFLKSQHDAPKTYAILKKQADVRGISLIFPFMDLQDQSSISATDIWGNFNDAILLASKRYQAQSTLTARLFKEPSGLWVSQWNLLILGEVQSWEIRDEKLGRVLASGIDELADKLAQQFTQRDQEGERMGLLVQINNVNSFKGFQELDDYLRNLATVKSLTLVQMEQDRLIYNIHFLGSQTSLIQEIRLGDLLNSVERSGGRSDNSDGDNHRYKPVILDDLDKNNETNNEPSAKANAREEAVNSLEKTPDTKNPSNETSEKIAEQEMPVVQEKLQPDLEYWFAR
ncbi:MAG: DUF2066 domain-containing protein [gamma proteobacterium symbiont of Bathyaustriella thionipta]|nr:DUF2066 domain-containing protein [gamma proteobacterium symbiont of Bathyaustriella thionipta]MCU7949095.1 DUF2066 domain-containing protein [gamma proteobacterium symbiont of Bathyaustriella thionipta]MCU7952791.1 DUF2066 domain-containing protein [gamma proteobacterium symbiont of Bathyaustriella thionipta]MCU7955682.1 DUF2066 domain-containing protein [gamma proteobacterium symbiont of Bathyaustriella thionipta]MCU7967996.1 DUF2066 domain-containing protein [gamma proteobacterium symbion